MTNLIKFEIQTAVGVWTDITSDVYLRGGLTITRGRSDEQSQASPQRMTFTIENRDGKYSPRNPLSPLYGKVGRNTPVRCTIDNGAFSRFYGEISGLAPRWDNRHADNFIPVEAYGILRRLGQGQPAVSNALRDWILAQSTLVAYYPLSGGEETIYSQNLAPGKTGSFVGVGAPVFTYGKDMPGWIGTGMELDATGDTSYMFGSSTASGDNFTFDFVWQSPAMGRLTLTVWDTPQNRWLVDFQDNLDGATVWVRYIDNTSGSTFGFSTVGPFPELQDQALHVGRFEVTTSGSDMHFAVYIDGTVVKSGTMSGFTWHDTQSFWLNYSRYAGQTVMNIAHLTMWTGTPIPTAVDMANAALGYVGETGIDRIIRVCGDGDIPLLTAGASAASQPMGPQFTETRLEQIRDVETTDMGILAERRDASGLLYLSSASLYNQTAAFTLAYNGGQVVAPLEPVDDDQLTRNDVTATRREGGSDRVTVDTGPLSTQDAPAGVGRYETEVTVNVETDDQLLPVASWVANIGTLDEARWPSVTVNLQSSGMTPTLRLAIKAADIGDLFTITGMQKAFIYDSVNLIIIGYTETIDPYVHTITFNCMPAEPYETFVIESTGSRISSGDTSLVNASMTTTATSLSVLSADAASLWTTAGGDMPISIMVAGEQMTVTAISGTTPGSAQTFTVTRSVNQVVKTHSTGEIVRLKRRAVLGL